MLKAFKYRLYPTNKQTELLARHGNSSRFMYNLALETKQTAFIGSKINLSCFDLIKQIPDLKKECEWLKEINSQTLQQAIVNLDIAFTKFFKGQSGFPKFKKKKNNYSFQIPQNVSVDFESNKLSLPKFREGISIVLHRKFSGTIKQITISKSCTNKYYASLIVETEETSKIKKYIKDDIHTIGIDLGLKNFIVASTGQKFENPKFLSKSLSKLKFIQKKYSKTKSKRLKNKLSILHENISNCRQDFLHKTSNILLNNHDNICVEDLNIAGLIKNHTLSLAISDVSWGEFLRLLTYKANWRGNNILKIGRFDPSSKCCSNCGYINRNLKLSEREWFCPTCKITHDRDLNAALNIKAFALKNHLSGEHRLKNQKELPTLVGVLTSEV